MNMSVKKEFGLVGACLSALLGLSILLLVLAMTGCTTGQGQPEQCANAQKVWDAYQVRLLVGPPPTGEEERIAAAARALLIIYCGAPGAAEPAIAGTREIGTVPWPRQPKKFATPGPDGSKVWWYRQHPFLIIQDPTGVIRLPTKGLETITTGPFYRRAWSQDLYLPDAAWLAGGPGYPVMSPIR